MTKNDKLVYKINLKLNYKVVVQRNEIEKIFNKFFI